MRARKKSPHFHFLMIVDKVFVIGTKTKRNEPKDVNLRIFYLVISRMVNFTNVFATTLRAVFSSCVQMALTESMCLRLYLWSLFFALVSMHMFPCASQCVRSFLLLFRFFFHMLMCLGSIGNKLNLYIPFRA